MVRPLAAALLAAALAACSPLDGGSRSCRATAPVDLVEVSLPSIAGRTGSFDAMAVDQPGHLLLVADRTAAGLDVLDVSSDHPAYLGTAPLGGSPNGVAAAPDQHRAYVGLEDGSLAVVDTDRASPGFLKATRVATGAKSLDLVTYDPDDHLAIAAAPEDGWLVLLGADGKLAGRISLAPGLEQPAYDGADHRVYVAASTTNSIWTVDMATRAATRSSLSSPCGPAGLAVDPGAQRAFLGCSSRAPQQVLTWDLRAQRIARVEPKAGAGDLAAYAAAEDRFLFAAGHDAGGPAIAVFDSAGRYLTAVGLPAASSGVAYDEANRLVYAADTRPGKGGLFKFAIPRC